MVGRRYVDPEGKVVIASDELGHPEQVGGVDGLEREVTGEVAEEADLSLPADARGEQVRDLGDDETGDYT